MISFHTYPHDISKFIDESSDDNYNYHGIAHGAHHYVHLKYINENFPGARTKLIMIIIEAFMMSSSMHSP